MGADKSFKNTPKCPKIYLPKLSVQAQKFEISMKSGFIGRPWVVTIGLRNLWKLPYPQYLS